MNAMMTDRIRKAPEIGSRLQALRKQQGLSLDDLAATSKVSRSMLSQVERGLANPTFATLWALTQALGIDISQLIGDAADARDQQIEVIEAHNIPRIQSADGHCTLRILSPPETTGEAEWYWLEIEPGASLTSQPHTAGCREHLSIIDGEAMVISAEVQQKAGAGATLRYRADVPHSISNAGKGRLQALLVVMTGS
jgi:transcriptional regulator with XRE-family HTH domain